MNIASKKNLANWTWTDSALAVPEGGILTNAVTKSRKTKRSESGSLPLLFFLFPFIEDDDNDDNGTDSDDDDVDDDKEDDNDEDGEDANVD